MPAIRTDDYLKQNAKLLLKLSEERKLTEVAIQEVIEGCRGVCKQTIMCTKQIVAERLTEYGACSNLIKDTIDAIDDNYEDPIFQLSSSYLRDKYYKENFPYLVSIIVFKYILSFELDVEVQLCTMHIWSLLVN